VSAQVAPTNPALQAALEAGIADGGEAASQMRALYRQLQRRAIAAAAPLSANARTIALGLSMTAGSPLYYFAYEAVGLTLVLVWSLRVQRQADAALLTALAAASAESASGVALRAVGV
jgi:hypothetical protein